MRYFRRLPPFLRAASIVGLLLILASLVLSTVSFFHIQPFLPPSIADTSRMQLVSMDLGMLGLALTIAINGYMLRLRQPDGAAFPRASWQSQARILAALTALPFCGLTLALVIPPSLPIYGLAFGISVFAAWVLFGGCFWMIAGGQSIDR